MQIKSRTSLVASFRTVVNKYFNINYVFLRKKLFICNLVTSNCTVSFHALHCLLIIYGLFNYALNNSNYNSSNYMEKSRNMAESCWRGLNGRTYFEVPALYFPEGSEDSGENFSKRSRFTMRDLNLGPLEWRVAVSTEWTRDLVLNVELYGLTKSAFLLRSIYLV